MPNPKIAQEFLRSILSYDPDSGLFRWKHRSDVRKAWNTRYAGKEAGYIWSPDPKTSYWNIRILDWPFLGHRLAWLYMTGEWPKIVIDHIDCNGLNNSWDNLRAATKSQNGANRGADVRNKLGVKGVRYIEKCGRYQAAIMVHKKQRFLGSFATVEEASAAYLNASREIFGEFARSI